MNNIIKISIIMPIFNSAKYLAQAIESVLNQSLNEFELICINDGSTDNSLEILEKYSARDSRIKIISKENEGQGVARNLALKKAEGEYIFYLDSDDWLEPNALELMYNKISGDGSDITIFNTYRFYESDNARMPVEYITSMYSMFGEDTFSPLDAQDIIFSTTALPFKIYRKEFLIRENIKYSSHKFIEDSLFYIKAMISAKKISCLNKYLYNYRVHPNSVSYSAGKNIHAFIEIFYMCEDILKESTTCDDFMYSYLDYKIMQGLCYYKKATNDKKKCYHYSIQKLFRHIYNTYPKYFTERKNIPARFYFILNLSYLMFKIKLISIAIKSHIN
ncbi:MAG: glycosyltransferase family 2 protein [Candidatus Gastranaerophilales bacterium]|nr:glycosyltransferase family 2 protein [Candidatus Gastranaerophilales bacterium]